MAPSFRPPDRAAHRCSWVTNVLAADLLAAWVDLHLYRILVRMNYDMKQRDFQMFGGDLGAIREHRFRPNRNSA